jgi:predicted LPLAT superfamily acyltransferase
LDTEPNNSAMAAKWQGQSKGTVLGHKIFVFVLNNLGLKPAYFILRFVSLYYFLFAFKSNKSARFFYHNALGFPKLKSRWFIYKNYYAFGQTILDKVATLAGVKTNITIDHKGGWVLDKMAEEGKGGLIISAHVGNWEMAGQKMNRLNTKFNILMYENERENLKRYMDDVQKQKSIKVIAIKEGDLSHLIELNNAFTNNELVVLHADRFRDGAPTIITNFFGKPAKFPIGPFVMAAKFGVTLTVAFSIKISANKYIFYASDPLRVQRVRGAAKNEQLVKDLAEHYVQELEKIVKMYPEQWFNFYPYWIEEETKNRK